MLYKTSRISSKYGNDDACILQHIILIYIYICIWIIILCDACVYGEWESLWWQVTTCCHDWLFVTLHCKISNTTYTIIPS